MLNPLPCRVADAVDEAVATEMSITNSRPATRKIPIFRTAYIGIFTYNDINILF